MIWLMFLTEGKLSKQVVVKNAKELLDVVLATEVLYVGSVFIRSINPALGDDLPDGVRMRRDMVRRGFSKQFGGSVQRLGKSWDVRLCPERPPSRRIDGYSFEDATREIPLFCAASDYLAQAMGTTTIGFWVYGYRADPTTGNVYVSLMKGLVCVNYSLAEGIKYARDHPRGAAVVVHPGYTDVWEMLRDFIVKHPEDPHTPYLQRKFEEERARRGFFGRLFFPLPE